jgi:hypothetical protein
LRHNGFSNLLAADDLPHCAIKISTEASACYNAICSGDTQTTRINMQLNQKYLSATLVGLALTSVLAGCGGGGGGGSSSSSSTGGGSSTPATTSVSATATDGLVATLSESSATVAVGGSITYTFTLSNNTGAAVSINASSPAPIAPDTVIVVKNSAGAIVLYPVPGSPPFDSASLASGQSLTATQVVSAFSSAGTYSATATFENPSAPIPAGPLTVTAS